MTQLDRRSFLRAGLGGTAGLAAAGCLGPGGRGVPFEISLAQWSLHRGLQAGALDPLDFPVQARAFGIGAVEYVNRFYRRRPGDREQLAELRRRCDGEGVRSLLIMCDGEGRLGDPDPERRGAAVARHGRWAEAAASLGCHSIRVNAESTGSRAEQARLCADGLRRLAEACEPLGLGVLVENHGGLSSDGGWLAGVLAATGHPRCGSLPDFGNFELGPGPDGEPRFYDRYQGVAELMPFARAVSAKSHDFDDRGEEVHTDFHRMLRIVVVEHGYHGYVGIEYEGRRLDEPDGIRATGRLLARIQQELA